MAHSTTSSGPSNQAGRPRRRDPKNTRERLVRAALDLFTTQGYHASTTPQVAKRAGVAEGTIYRHFASKEQLLNEIYRGAVRLFGKIVTDVPAQIPCRERLRAIATKWCEVAASDPPLVKLVFVSPPEPLLDAKSREAYDSLLSELEKAVASGKASGEIRPGPVYLWSAVWLQLVTLVLNRVATNQWGPQHSAPSQVVASAWDAIAVPVSDPDSSPGQSSPASLPAGR